VYVVHHRDAENTETQRELLEGGQHTHRVPAVLCVLCVSVVN
jgi:hypothetical protein